MKIRALINEVENEAHYYWRVNLPFRYLRTYDIDAKTVVIGEEIDAETDILLLPKLYVRAEDQDEAQAFFYAFKEAGGIIVYDADDDMWSEDFTSYLANMTYHKTGEPQLLNTLIDELEIRRLGNLWTVMQCDAITVSNDTLADYVRLITNKPVYVVPNAIDVESFTNSLSVDDSLIHPHYTTIGWAGGARPPSELDDMLQAWNILARLDVESKLKFVTAGWNPLLVADKTAKRFPFLTSNNVIHIPWTGMSQYANNMTVDIGCVCVGDNNFSKRKTTIKAWEFALTGAMVVGSDILYSNEPIVVCSNVEDWVNVLRYYINDIESREAMALAYKQYVKNYNDIKYNWMDWASAYEQIIKYVGQHENNPVAVS